MRLQEVFLLFVIMFYEACIAERECIETPESFFPSDVSSLRGEKGLIYIMLSVEEISIRDAFYCTSTLRRTLRDVGATFDVARDENGLLIYTSAKSINLTKSRLYSNHDSMQSKGAFVYFTLDVHRCVHECDLPKYNSNKLQKQICELACDNDDVSECDGNCTETISTAVKDHLKNSRYWRLVVEAAVYQANSSQPCPVVATPINKTCYEESGFFPSDIADLEADDEIIYIRAFTQDIILQYKIVLLKDQLQNKMEGKIKLASDKNGVLIYKWDSLKNVTGSRYLHEYPNALYNDYADLVIYFTLNATDCDEECVGNLTTSLSDVLDLAFDKSGPLEMHVLKPVACPETVTVPEIPKKTPTFDHSLRPFVILAAIVIAAVVGAIAYRKIRKPKNMRNVPMSFDSIVFEENAATK